jgi:hypothetical protein
VVLKKPSAVAVTYSSDSLVNQAVALMKELQEEYMICMVAPSAKIFYFFIYTSDIPLSKSVMII